MRKALNHLLAIIVLSLAPTMACADWVPLRLEVDKVSIGDLNVDLPKKGEVIIVKGSQLLTKLSPYLQPEPVHSEKERHQY